jgi:hypothetical protein
MTHTVRPCLVALAAFGIIAADPAFAAGATRSATALPLLAASVGSVPYRTGAESAWRCTRVTDEVLKLKKVYVQVDEAGRVVLDPKGAPFGCRPPPGSEQVGTGAGFPFKILLGILGIGALSAGLAGGGSDSTG